MDKMLIVALFVGFCTMVSTLFTLLKDSGAPFDLRSGLLFFGLPVLAGAVQGSVVYLSLLIIKWAIL